MTMHCVVVAAATAVALLLAACGGGDAGPRGELAGLDDLRGRTVAVASLDGVPTLELRYLLRAEHDLEAAVVGGDVTLVESPVDSLQNLLESGEIDAALFSERKAFQLRDDERVYVLAHLAADTRDLTGEPVLATILATYPDVAAEKPAALEELRAVLSESLTYFVANQDAVIDAVAADGDEREFLHWWWDRQDLIFGDTSSAMQAQLLNLWGVSQTLGDIDGYPTIEAALFWGQEGAGPDDGPPGATRTTVTLAVLDDPGRRCALYALEQRLITSDRIDVNLTYLPLSALQEAVPARQYDVVETSPLAVPQNSNAGLGLMVLSGGLQDLDGTLLFVRSASSGD